MSKTRSNLYKAARIMGDFEAAGKGRLVSRMVRKKVYAKSLGGLGKFFR